MFLNRRFWLSLVAFVAGCGTFPGSIGQGVSLEAGVGSSDGPISVYFSEVFDKPAENKRNPDNIALHCASYIAAAQRTLDIACHEIDNRVIIDAVVEAHKRGVKVRVITETDYENDLGPVTFQENGIPVISDHRKALMHSKFMVIDGVAVWTGSFNFTESCAYRNNNNGIVIRDTRVADNYTNWFDWFWEYGKNGHKAGPPESKRTPHPRVALTDGTHLENRFTTFDKLDVTAIDMIRKAKRSIKFLAFSFTHKAMAKAMADRAAEGVQVVGVFEARNLTGSEFNFFMEQENCTVYQDGNPFNMHHKVIIIDDQIVMTGSFNFSSNATHENDENIVIIDRNPQVAAKYVEEFNRVLKQATSAAIASSEGGGGRRARTRR